MAHELQERYSKLVNAKLRRELVLKDGVVFNNDYEGSPSAGSVKIPARDTEVQVSDYDKANGISGSTGTTEYITMNITKDKAINEIIDGYDAASVPDDIVAERLDSGTCSLAEQIDTDGGTTLIAGSTPINVQTLTKDNIYSTIVDVRKVMNKAHVPKRNRYLLVTPDAMALVLKSPEFTDASSLGDSVKETGAIGKVAGFLVIEWEDETANLAMIAGHPRFATRAREFSVPVHLQDLSGSGNYIGASAIQGRNVYDHKVTRSNAIRAVYSPAALSISLAAATGEGASGKTVATITAGNTGNTYAYKINPSSRAAYDMTSTAYGGTSLTSGTTAISVSAGDILEIVNLSSSKVKAVGYITVASSDIAT